MSTYGVTQVHFENGQLERVMLHVVDAVDGGGFFLQSGQDTPAADVANHLKGGDRVLTFVAADNGDLCTGDEVQCKSGSDYLTSVQIEGRARKSSLADLPQY